MGNIGLGVLLARLHRTQLALQHLKAALEADPSQARHWFSLVDALLAAGQPSAAASVLGQGLERGLSGPGVELLSAKVNQALKRKPDDDLGRGNELAQAGRFEEAIVSLATRCDSSPTIPVSTIIWAPLYFVRGGSAMPRRAIGALLSSNRILPMHITISPTYRRLWDNSKRCRRKLPPSIKPQAELPQCPL